jgi:hypothetical protein
VAPGAMPQMALFPHPAQKAAKTVESYMPGWASKKYQAIDEALVGR